MGKSRKKQGVSALAPSTFSVPVSLGELSPWHIALWENEFLIAWRNPFSHKTVSVTPVRQNYVGKMDSALPLLRWLCLCVRMCVHARVCVCVFERKTRAERKRMTERKSERKNCIHGFRHLFWKWSAFMKNQRAVGPGKIMHVRVFVRWFGSVCVCVFFFCMCTWAVVCCLLSILWFSKHKSHAVGNNYFVNWLLTLQQLLEQFTHSIYSAGIKHNILFLIGKYAPFIRPVKLYCNSERGEEKLICSSAMFINS